MLDSGNRQPPPGGKEQGGLCEIAENLHRCDLTKEQRDEHIRRYAELLERQRDEVIVCQNDKQLSRPVGRPKAIVTEVAEATGLNTQTVRRALNPKPKVVDIKSAIEPESAHDAIIREANAIVSAWNQGSGQPRYQIAHTRRMPPTAARGDEPTFVQARRDP